MTGYASRNLLINSTLLQLEIKSVNHRFADITIKTNEDFRPLENTIRNLISKTINRGKIDFKCFSKENIEEKKELQLNETIFNQYIQLLNKINAITSNPAPISATDLLALPGIFKSQDLELEEMQPIIIENIEQLLKDYQETQATEGTKLEEVIRTRLNSIGEIVTSAQPIISASIEEYKQKLQQRLIEAIGESNISDTRLQQEFTFFCQKADVYEEIDRLQAHVQEFRKLLDNGGTIGKRLDFICQEMHREANTFGSKSISITATQKSVDLKVLIEQIREQVQNIM